MTCIRKPFALLALSAIVPLTSPARPVVVNPPIVSDFPDTEVATNVVMAAWDGSMRFLDFTLEFNASPSNCFMAAFGHDSDHSGELSAGETGMTVGWDCGNWVVENAKTGDTYIETNSVPSGVRSLNFMVRVDRVASVRSFEVKDVSSPVFATLADPAPKWVYDRSWNIVRLSARGFSRGNERFVINQTTNGFHVRLK